MTVMATPFTGAPSASPSTWQTIQWKQVVTEVRQLQMRIAKAYREGKHGKAKALQWILTHSFSAKVLAVRRVVQNRGAKTPGTDQVIWKTSRQKMQAAISLKRRGYQTKPLKRIYISKKDKSKLRPLSIPSMQCRAMQALYLLALEPIVEIKADKNAYGFRPLRSTADAVEQCFNSLARRCSSEYILEGDIRACFDTISHPWLLQNTPMDTQMLRKWLIAGYIEKGQLHSTELGTPQGGLISATLLVNTLSGLEQAIKAVTKPRDKVNICIYADDFIITGVSEELLMNKVKPVVENFLGKRGLTLSPEKTKLSHITEGFDFLGMNIRKYNNKLIIKPAKSSVKRFLADIRETIKHNATAKTENLIRLLNQKIRGWANYYAHVCSKKTFSYVDHQIFAALWRWSKRRHSTKNKQWIKNRYFRRHKNRDWIFFAKSKKKEGHPFYLDIVIASQTPIKRHVKIKADATPFDPAYHHYFNKRITTRMNDKKKPAGKQGWWSCWWNLLDPTKKTDYTGLRQVALLKA
jgi:RNA-directed DNA polymerase